MAANDPMAMLKQMGIDMGPGFWDNPMVANLVFHPRKAPRAERPDIKDGTIPVDDAGTAVGYRLYLNPSATSPAVLVHFHGNAEVAADMDHGIAQFREMGLAVLAMDYRGYGWSEGGLPKVSALMGDTEKVAAAIPGILAGAGLGGAPVVLYGRSLGATCVAHIAANTPLGKGIKGVIVEAGLMALKALPVAQQMAMMLPGGQQLVDMVPEPFGSVEKVARAGGVPLLVMHGDRDELIPISEAVKCHAASTSATKRLVRFPGAGHNDITARALNEYLAAIKDFLGVALGGAAGGPSEKDLKAMGVKDLKALLAARGVDYSQAVEKGDLVKLALGK